MTDSVPFVYEQVYEFLSDEEKLEWLRKEMREELGPEWEKVKNDMFSERKDMVNEAIFDNYAEQGAIMKRLEKKNGLGQNGSAR